MIILQPPASIRDTQLYRKLASSDPEFGLSNLADQFIKAADPIVDSIIAGPFQHYTLHNRDHVKKVVHLAEYVMGEHTLQLLSPAECLLFLYAAYLHDMGMATTTEERKRLIASESYRESVEQWPEMKDAFDQVRKKLKSAPDTEEQALLAELADLQQATLANYLRPLHATAGRYRHFIQLLKTSSGRADLFQINGHSFERDLILICESHNLPATVLGEMISAHVDRFPRRQPITNFLVNTQYLAAVLRIADILDFDHERTPRSLFESLGIRYSTLPGAEVTLFEWRKHLAVRVIEINQDEIVISGDSTHPIIEAGIKEFCTIIQKEIQETLAVLRRNPDEIQDTYQISLPPLVRASVRSDGYTFMDLALKLDEGAVMSLLMGNQLYDSPLAAVRELIQNAVDACVVRKFLVRDPTYEPKVSVRVVNDGDGTWLVVADNGIGMDEYVLKHHFFTVGSSYYRSIEFKQLTRTTASRNMGIGSKFGIGFISTFMLSKEIEIETRKLYPGGGFSNGHRIRIERMGALAFVQEDECLNPGTTVKLRLKTTGEKPITTDQIRKYVIANVVRPACEVEVLLSGRPYIIGPDNFYKLHTTKKSEVNKLKIEVVDLSIEHTDGVRGKVILVLGEDDGGLLHPRVNDQTIEFTESSPERGRVKVNPRFLLPNFEGNRITVAGFRMSLTNLGRLLRSSRHMIAAIYDVDIAPGEDVDFNVPRTKLLDQQMKIRLLLRKAINEELARSGYMDRLAPDTHSLIAVPSIADGLDVEPEEMARRVEKLRSSGRFEVDSSLLESVQALLPRDKWPERIHRVIAEKLNVRPGEVHAAISTLIATRRVKKPNPSTTIGKTRNASRDSRNSHTKR